MHFFLYSIQPGLFGPVSIFWKVLWLVYCLLILDFGQQTVPQIFNTHRRFLLNPPGLPPWEGRYLTVFINPLHTLLLVSQSFKPGLCTCLLVFPGDFQAGWQPRFDAFLASQRRRMKTVHTPASLVPTGFLCPLYYVLYSDRLHEALYKISAGVLLLQYFSPCQHTALSGVWTGFDNGNRVLPKAMTRRSYPPNTWSIPLFTPRPLLIQSECRPRSIRMFC